MTRRYRRGFLLGLVLAAALALSLAGNAAGAIAPPWCGTPEPDAAGALPDGTQPTDPVGSFPHIPYYAIKCTLDSIQAQSNGRMSVEQIGVSALGRPLYLVTINALDTKQQRVDYKHWRKVRRLALTDPTKAQRRLSHYGNDVKVPIFIQAAIHGNEYESVDAAMRVIERMAETPHGTDPEVDAVLDHVILLINIDQNPDGRVAGTRANGNGFDLNRDFLTQAQSETKASVGIMQHWLPPDMLDGHGYETPTLVEATTKPHNPGIDYDLWLKWNQPRTLANKNALAAIGLGMQRPVNDWCSNADLPPPSGICPDGNPPGPAVAEGWDDWGPFYTPMYSQLVGLNGSTVEMCSSTGTGCGAPGATDFPRGRLAALTAQMTVDMSTLAFDIPRRNELMNDELEIYKRGVDGAPRPACCPPPFDVANNWMHEYPDAYVIPLGAGQRSDAEANRLVRWLLFNGIEVSQLKKDASFGSQTFPDGSYVVWMNQPHRGLAETALSIGVDVSNEIGQLYAPPGAWSHGYLWGADIVQIPRQSGFEAKSERIDEPTTLGGGLASGRADRYALVVNSATAVRMLNGLLANGVAADLATASFSGGGRTYPAGTVLFASDSATRNALIAALRGTGIHLGAVSSSALPAVQPVATPKIAVLATAVNQDVWSLRNLGFTADPISIASLNASTADPLTGYNVVFDSGMNYPADTPANANARARLAAFFARGGGYIGAGATGAAFLTSGGQVTGLTAATRGGAGRSGIVYWNNTGGVDSVVTGAYPAQDTAIFDPPTWFTSVPSTLTVDARFPLTGFFAAGLWLLDAASATAPGSAIVAHGTNTAGTSKVTVFAMNPLYRADPEREWPELASSAYWSAH